MSDTCGNPMSLSHCGALVHRGEIIQSAAPPMECARAAGHTGLHTGRFGSEEYPNIVYVYEWNDDSTEVSATPFWFPLGSPAVSPPGVSR